MNQKQIIAYYLRNMLNSDLGLMTDITFVQNLPRYSMEIFDIDIMPLLKTLPDGTSDEAKIGIYREILNGKIEILDDSNLPQITRTKISDAMPKMHVTDITAYDFDKNLSFIADAFDLSPQCRRLLQFFVYIPKMPALRDVLENFMGPIDRNFIDEDNAIFFSDLCHVPANEIKNLLSPQSVFFTSGILMNKMGNIRLAENFTKLLSRRFNSSDEVHNFLVGEPIKSDLTVDNFIHIADDFDAIKQMLKMSAKKSTGVNILLYGETGTGKTSFAAAVTAAAGLKLYYGAHNRGDNDARCNELFHTMELLKNDSRAVLLIDDAKEILQQDNKFMRNSSDKTSINDILEANSRPIIWITNNLKDIDKSCLRRFSLNLEIQNPDAANKETVWRHIFKKHKLKISDSKLSEIIQNNDVSIAILDTAVKNAKLTGNLDMIQYTINKLSPIPNRKKSQQMFDTKLLNTDTDLKILAERIATKKLNKFSLCLYGAPGTGKTAYASYLGGVLNMPVIKKRASDLKDSYVGNTEKNIAAAFAEARAKKAILVFDEADSFLQNRASAHQAWEFGLVNEMLTQMENAEFPFICTTNLMDTLDSAALRRFTFKVKYDYLTQPQVVLAFNEFFGIKIDEADIKKCTHLAPGDFVVVKNKANIMDITDPHELINMLVQEQSARLHNKNKIGF